MARRCELHRPGFPLAERTTYDLWYVENWSLWLDIKIIFRTFREVVFYREG